VTAGLPKGEFRERLEPKCRWRNASLAFFLTNKVNLRQKRSEMLRIVFVVKKHISVAIHSDIRVFAFSGPRHLRHLLQCFPQGDAILDRRIEGDAGR
jgi:hypothetical protein